MTGRGVLPMLIVVVDLGTEIPLDLTAVMIEHFEVFRRKPLRAKDSSTLQRMTGMFSLSSIMTRSSAKARADVLMTGPIVPPVEGLLFSCSIILSIVRLNSAGLSGSPWRTPLLIFMGADCSPLTCTLVVALLSDEEPN